MSITLSNWKQISNSPTNRSPSKMVYSFSRASRFSPNKENKGQTYYDIASKQSKRATGFGYGNKYDFTKDFPTTPPPNSYQIKSMFQDCAKSNRGHCFGQGRQEMIISGPLAETINNKNPGPGAYEPMKKQGKIAFSIKGKYKDPQPESERIPGPGTYQENNFFSEKGDHHISKFKTSKGCKLNSGGVRFKSIEIMAPGPGQYDTSHAQFSPSGKYTLSNLQNSKVRSFGNSQRDRRIRCETPGPGNYRLPSEFGYYAPKKEYFRSKCNESGQPM